MSTSTSEYGFHWKHGDERDTLVIEGLNIEVDLVYRRLFVYRSGKTIPLYRNFILGGMNPDLLQQALRGLFT